MRLIARFVGTAVLLLSTFGILACIAGIVGIWMYHYPAIEKVQNITARLDDGFQRASVANQNVQRALEQARAAVEKVNKESTALTGGVEKSRRTTKALRNLIRQQVGPNVSDLGAKLATLSDAATAVSSLLQSFQELPLGQIDRIPPDRLEGWTDQATQLSVTVRRLEAAVGDGNKESGGAEIAAASRAVVLALQRCQAKVDAWQSELGAARDEVRYVKTKILAWLTSAAIVVTLLCGWVAVAQISLFAHALSWYRGC